MSKSKETVPKKPRTRASRKNGPGVSKSAALKRAVVAPDAFTVTNSAAALTLGPDRISHATCTVTNNSGETLRGQVRMLARPPEVFDWLTVMEEVERDYEAGASQLYTIRVEAPPEQREEHARQETHGQHEGQSEPEVARERVEHVGAHGGDHRADGGVTQHDGEAG